MTIFLTIGATFYFVPQTLAIEANSQSYLSGLATFLDSASNHAWAGPILVVSLLGFAATAGLIFYRVVIGASRRLAAVKQAGPATSRPGAV